MISCLFDPLSTPFYPPFFEGGTRVKGLGDGGMQVLGPLYPTFSVLIPWGNNTSMCMTEYTWGVFVGNDLVLGWGRVVQDWLNPSNHYVYLIFEVVQKVVQRGYKVVRDFLAGICELIWGIGPLVVASGVLLILYILFLKK